VKNFFDGKKVLITGHSGFKGSWLTHILSNWGAEVVGVSLEPETDKNLFDIVKLEKRVKSYFVDVRDFKKVSEVFEKEKPEIVFHLAAQAIVRRGYDEPYRTYSTNTFGTINIMQAIKDTETVKSAVIITTDKVYENKEWIYHYRENDPLGGHDPYSASKVAADILADSYINSFFKVQDYKKKHNTLIAIARAGNVIGGGDWSESRIVPDIIRSIYENKETIILRSPKAVRPWEHVLEPLSGYMMLAKGLYEGNTSLVGAWNFGPEDESFVYVEDLVKGALSIIGEGDYRVEPDTSGKHEAGLLKLHITKAKDVLGWQPKLDIKGNLKYTFGWYDVFYKDPKNIIDFTDSQIDSFFRDV
jgi:CDP-glucose 4,6-dehydratase